jgi:hypothetical protein
LRPADSIWTKDDYVQEVEFRQRFDVVRNDITLATSLFYTYMEIHKFASEGRANSNKINRDAYFWMGQLYALQATWFIVLGRLFDPRGYCSIRKFLAATVAHEYLFSKGALAERKRRATQQDNPEWLEEYLRTAWEPTAQDLQVMADSIGTAEAKWKQSYKPIRDKVFAHHDLGISVNDLFGKTLVGDIEDILHDLNRIRIAIFQLLENARQIWIADDDKTYIDPFITDARNFLGHL